MISYKLMFPGVRSFLVFSGFELKPPALNFSLILTIASRLFHLYSTNDKTSRLMVKRFSMVSDRFTELHEEENREEGDRGDQEEKKGSQKERVSSSQ